MRSRTIAVCVAFWLCLIFSGEASSADLRPGQKRTALDDYIARPDPTYSWKLVKTIPGDGCKTFVLDLKSQTWRTEKDVDRTVWQHWLLITRPDDVSGNTAMLKIGGGKNGGNTPDRADPLSLQFAKASKTVVADLGMVPNQPLTFNNDGQARVEDDLIAYCHIKSMDTGDKTWLPRLPMVKSAVRAMDAVTEFLATDEGGRTKVEKFVVAGGSKRGWTTWLTGAVDTRVVAIVPAVIDVVNVMACKTNHWESYGFWAPAVGDYTRHKIHERFDTPEYQQLLKTVDPYYYFDRLSMPKFVINSAGDQYFPPDSSKFYFPDLKGEKYLRYVPNTDHSLKNSDGRDSILAFYKAVLAGVRLPKFIWAVREDGSIFVQTQDKPIEVNLWEAVNPKARDFRLVSIGAAYQKTRLESVRPDVFIARVQKPPQGWKAYFVELVYNSSDKIPYKFTTEVAVLPDVLPFKFDDFRKSIKQSVKTAGQ